jgi:hypothetical protein
MRSPWRLWTKATRGSKRPRTPKPSLCGWKSTSCPEAKQGFVLLPRR